MLYALRSKPLPICPVMPERFHRTSQHIKIDSRFATAGMTDKENYLIGDPQLGRALPLGGNYA